MSPLITLGCSSMFGMGRLGSRWQVLCLEFSADDDEDEQEAMHIISYHMYWVSAAVFD